MCSETKESKKTKHIQFILLPRYKMFWGHWTWQTSIRIILSSANFTTNLLLLPLNWHPPSKRPLWKPSKGIQGASPTDTYPARYDLPRHNNEAHSNGPDCSENCWRIETKLGNLKNTWVFPRCSAIFRLFFSVPVLNMLKTTYTLLPSRPIHYGKHVGIGHCETNKFQYVLGEFRILLAPS